MIKILAVLVSLTNSVISTGYPSPSSLGYGFSGTASNYPIVHYPAIQPPAAGYTDQHQVYVPGYKHNNGGGHGYEIRNQPVPSYPNNNCCEDGDNKIYPPPSGYNGYGKPHHGGNHVINAGYGGSGPDLSDPCFQRYPNCMIVNAQPYERRSSISIQDCKNNCLNNSTVSSNTVDRSYNNGRVSNNGQLYRCRSFVYDTQNQICDLYSHIGNAYPSQLIQYYGKDYYEPTGNTGNCGTSVTVTVSPPVTPVVPSQFTCPAGQEARFIKTTGSRFTSSGATVSLDNVSEDQCIEACSNNQASDGRQALCKSFNYNLASRQCQILQDSAPSTPGGGQNLITDQNANYYEKICLDANLVRNCPKILERLPQKVLVGFAEVVTSATSTSDCLQKCLNSQQLFNFNCASGMYYADQTSPDTNCILNFETRRSHPELFTDDNSDKVDYFELNCGNTVNTRQSLVRSVNQRRTAAFSRQISSDNSLAEKPEVFDIDNTQQSRETSFNDWTQWTPCDRNSDGRRVRYRRCSKSSIKDCPLESERCRRETLQGSSRFAIQKDIDEAPISNSKESMCNLDVCCPILGGCRIGLLRSSTDNKLRWCSDPCKTDKTKE